MITRIKVLLIGLIISQSSFGQINNDSIYQSLRLVPRFGINIQKGYGLECGLFLNNFYTRFPRHPQLTMLPYTSSGFYISSEMSFQNFNDVVIGPKIGWELSVIGETHGSFFGAEFINYTNFKDYSPALMLKIGLPLMWLNIGYGYTMFLENTLKNEIGKHRLTLTYSINRKANKEFKRIQENLKNRQKNK
jgi:hypothetical protein